MLYLAVLNRMYDENTSIITQNVFLSCVYAMMCREDAIGDSDLDSIAVAPPLSVPTNRASYGGYISGNAQSILFLTCRNFG